MSENSTDLSSFTGRLAFQQRVLPTYRTPFFDLLSQRCLRGLYVFAGQPLPVEAITTSKQLATASFTPTRNRHFFHPRHPLYICWQEHLINWLEDTQPDALIVEANPRILSTRRAIQWMHLRGKPVLGWGLGAPPLSGLFSGWRSRSRRRFLHSLDGVIAYSRRGAEEYRALGIPPECVFVAHNATAPPPVSPPPKRPPSFPDRPTVLFVGRLQARKRVDNLLRACAALPEHIQPRLVVIGDGPQKESLLRLAMRVYPRTTFPGSIYGPHLDPFFTSADLFVLPGSGGLAIQQAMAHALPVIVARGDGTQEDLVRPQNGWLIPPDDLPSLTHALQNALSDPARLRRMGEQSYRIVVEEINLQTMIDSFVTALNRVCQNFFHSQEK